VVVLVAGPWFLLVHFQTGGAFTREFFWTHHVERFLEPFDNHPGPWWYYGPAILAGFFPWSVFAVPAVFEAYRALRGGGRGARAMLLLVCWTAVFVLFFTKASTKLPNYVLPAYPAIALIVGSFIDRSLREAKQTSAALPRVAFVALALAGGVMIAAPLVLRIGRGGVAAALDELGASPGLAEPLELVAWLGGVLLVGGVAALACDLLARRGWSMGVMAAAAATFVAAALGGVALSVDRLQSSDDLTQAVRDQGASQPRLAQFGYFRPSLVYYSRQKVEGCRDVHDVAAFLTQSQDNFLVMPAETFERIKRQLPADAVVVERFPQFPKQGEVLLVARRSPRLADRPRLPPGTDHN